MKDLNKNLEKILKLNGHHHLFNYIENIKPSEADLVAKGIEFVYDNFECAQNAGVLDYVINYLQNKHSQYQEDCSTHFGTLSFKDNEWFFRWTDLIYYGMSHGDDDYMFTPIAIDGLDISDWKDGQTARCLVKVFKYDEITFTPILKAYFKEIVKK